MEEHETVLSDVHLTLENSEKLFTFELKSSRNEIEVFTTKIFFKNNFLETDIHPIIDSDGDFDVTRSEFNDFILLQHSSSTPLSHVGLQVWNGALILGDFILHEKIRWSGKNVLELGSGTGLCSILLGMTAKNVICTDVGEAVLKTCERNIERNSGLINGKIEVRELDWLRKTDEDYLGLNDICFLFASDVIYDDDLTDAFFETIQSLMMNKKCILYLSLEKRLNFTLSDLEVAAPAYDHFDNHLKKLLSMYNKWRITPMEINFPQYFQYDRSKYLELWEISCE